MLHCLIYYILGMSELLFECYSVPQVAYGVDSLFSFNYNMKNVPTALVVSSSYAATHVIPIHNGDVQVQFCKRLQKNLCFPAHSI